MVFQTVSEDKERNIIQNTILKWWSKNKRDFPWRNTKNPYHIIIAELLLRKTTAGQVEKIYSSFIKKYPNPHVLFKADKSELKEMIKPLGMEHKRTKLLKKFAEFLTTELNSKIKCNDFELLKIPGVGSYAKNAVLCLSFNKDEPLLDTNFIRFIKRVYGLNSSKARIRDDKNFWNFAKSIIPKGIGRKFNLAILDFSSIVCTARNPQCSTCPINNFCNFYLKSRMFIY